MTQSPTTEFYLELMKGRLEDQEARKASLEQRGIAVITTSGTIVTLLFGLAALLTKGDGFTPAVGTVVFLAVSLVLFVIAIVFGLATNRPRVYDNFDETAFDVIIKERWDRDLPAAHRMIAKSYRRFFASYLTQNAEKARLLKMAMTFEVLGIVTVAFAVGVILINAL